MTNLADEEMKKGHERRKLYAEKDAFEAHFESIGRPITKEWDHHTHQYAFRATWNLFASFREGRKQVEDMVAEIAELRAKVESLAADAEPIELKGVQEQIDESSGFWRSCSGCLETEDGHPVGRYPYSNVFKCQLGNGCSECGGIGAVWDNIDYESMAKEKA